LRYGLSLLAFIPLKPFEQSATHVAIGSATEQTQDFPRSQIVMKNAASGAILVFDIFRVKAFQPAQEAFDELIFPVLTDTKGLRPSHKKSLSKCAIRRWTGFGRQR
jgi:hypothetical protein